MALFTETITAPEGHRFDDLVDHVTETEGGRKDLVRERLSQELRSGSTAFRLVLTHNNCIVKWSKEPAEMAQ